ncbi:hypothetical protein [Nocardia sp. NPDC051832]|uniref:hypothetical protein n=1 Tax=Nocardia sp. NPDC051832 TaxID=3155673 RepID=UPI00342A5FFB
MRRRPRSDKEPELGEFVAYSPQELRQHALRQRDPEFTTWLAAMDEDLERLALDEAPELGPRPWGPDRLPILEQALLRHFPTGGLAPTMAQYSLFERFARGVGHIFASNLDGTWVYATPIVAPGAPAHPVVEVPPLPVWIDPGAFLSEALTRRTGAIFDAAYQVAATEHRHWTAAGSPDPEQWARAH